MKKTAVYYFLVLMCILSAFLTLSCQELFTTSPNIPNAVGGSVQSIAAPSGLTATNGLKRKIKLTWNAVPGAKRYYIYHADSPSSAFVQVGESDKENYDDNVPSGVIAYYKICAVDSQNEKSYFSSIVKGSSLAVPIISSIDATGDGAVIRWYMENYTEYVNDLCYEIHWQGSGVSKSEVIPGSLGDYTVTGLNSNAHYEYYVEAYLASDKSSKETSETVDAETVLNYVPHAPAVNVEQGKTTDSIKLYITIPPMVQVKTKDAAAGTPAVYGDFPLFFKIQRRVKPNNDSVPWTDSDLVDFGGSNKFLKWDGTSSNTCTVAADSDGNAVIDVPYNPGDIIEWTDTSANGLVRGVQYQYRVTSVVQFGTKTVPSAAAATGMGWLAAKPVFAVKDCDRTLTDTDPPVVKSYTLNFAGSWNDFGKASLYRYSIKAERSVGGQVKDSEFLSDGSGKTVYDSLASIDTVTCYYDLEHYADKLTGGYTYTLYIYSNEYTTAADGAANCLDFTRAPGTTDISASIEKPKINNFYVESGYKNKVNLKWDIEAGVEYYVIRTEKSSGTDKPITSDILKSATGAYTGEYSDTDVEAGKEYSYELWADNMGSTNHSEPPLDAKVLGKPAPEFQIGSLSYDTVTVKWKVALAAESYDIKIGNSAPLNVSASDLANTVVTDANPSAVPIDQPDYWAEQNQAGEITFKYKKPAGWDDASLSGKPVDFTVTAKSTVDANESEKIQVYTAGPAEIHISTSPVIQNDYIEISWDKLEGANSYIVVREQQISWGNRLNAVKVFYKVDSSGSVDSQYADAVEVKLSADGKRYTLKDKQRNRSGDGGTPWEVSQSRIIWGIPYHYWVLPAGSDTDGNLDETRLDGYVTNTDAAKTEGYTKGYGLNVVAEKAESPDAIKVTWDPHKYTGIAWLCKRLKGTNDWTVAKLISQGATSVELNKSEIADPSKIYDFAVSYDPSLIKDAVASFSSSYPEYMESLKDSDEEQLNQGYLFSLPYITASNVSGTFAENVNWKLYASGNGRKKGPDAGSKYGLWIKNTNRLVAANDGWEKIADVNLDGTYTTFSGADYDVDYTVMQGGETGSLNLKPRSVSEITHAKTDGILKVLRDPRHYYKLTATRTNGNGDIITAEIGNDMKTFACRQITNEELAKAAMYHLAYGFYINDGGYPDLSNVDQHFKYMTKGQGGTKNGETGSFSFSEKIGQTNPFAGHFSKASATFVFNAYDPKLRCPSGNDVTFLAITTPRKTFWLRTASDIDPYIIEIDGETEMTVTMPPNNNTGMDYSCTVKFNCDNEKSIKLSIVRNTVSYDLANNGNSRDERRKWFPLQMDNDDRYHFKNTGFGWWPYE